jgi:hypothetical protein
MRSIGLVTVFVLACAHASSAAAEDAVFSVQMGGSVDVAIGGGEDTGERDEVREADYPIYVRALGTGLENVQQAALAALANYSQAFTLCADTLDRRPNGRNAVAAANAVARFKDLPGYEARVMKTLAKLDALKPGYPVDQVRGTLLKTLYEKDRKKYGRLLLEELRRHLAREGDNISFGDDVFDRITDLSFVLPKKDLYPLVPRLISLLEKAFFPDVQTKAYRCLTAITGESYPLAERAGTQARQEVAEQYRKLYYTKLAK